MTAGERLMAQGAEEYGRRLLLDLLRTRFGTDVDREVERRIAESSVSDINVWGRRMLSAATIADVFAA